MQVKQRREHQLTPKVEENMSAMAVTEVEVIAHETEPVDIIVPEKTSYGPLTDDRLTPAQTEGVEQLVDKYLSNHKHLEAVRLIDPTIESIDSLGDSFCALLATGQVDAVTAYYATVGRQTTPKDNGSLEHIVKSGGSVFVQKGKDIPSDQLSEWQEMFPHADSAGLRVIYNKALSASEKGSY